MDSPFPDGAWRGFYVYPTDDSRHYMDLRLTFREGTLSGVGDDDVGPFVIRGRYDVLTLEVHWTKTYIGRHSVFYKGYGEPARIWGTWELSGMTGGFKIWPGDGDGSSKRTAEAEVEEPDRAWLPVATPGMSPEFKVQGRRGVRCPRSRFGFGLWILRGDLGP